MQQSNAPAKLVLPFANSGAKNTIPAASQIGIVAGAASLTDGFPPLTRTPLVAGGTPPSGLDMNGILFALAGINRWSNAGGRYTYDSTFATDDNVNGYPRGAVVLRSDGLGGWLNTVENNTTDPEAGGAGWVPDFQYGITAITMTNANVTLTALQAGRPIIVITGALTANLNLILPTYNKTWVIVNNTTGSFTITARTVAGSGIVVVQNASTQIYGNGTNIDGTTVTVSDASTTVIGIVELATDAETQTGTDTVRALTPSNLTARTATETRTGIVELATDAETQTGTDTVRALTPSNLTARTATETRTGIVELATNAEAQTGTDTVRALTPSNLTAAFRGTNQSLTANGYQRLPGGMILQWGTTASIATGVTANVTLPIAFQTTNLYSNTIGVGVPTVGSNTNNAIDTRSTTAISFVNRYLNSLPFNWFAIGY